MLVVLGFLRILLWMIGLLPTRSEDKELARILKQDLHDVKTSLTQIVDSHKDLHTRLEQIRLDIRNGR